MKLTEGREANPFYSPIQGHECYTIHSDGMIDRVKTFTLAECDVALKLEGLQKTVRAAVERRVRKLQKEAHATCREVVEAAGRARLREMGFPKSRIPSPETRGL